MLKVSNKYVYIINHKSQFYYLLLLPTISVHHHIFKFLLINFILVIIPCVFL